MPAKPVGPVGHLPQGVPPSGSVAEDWIGWSARDRRPPPETSLHRPSVHRPSRKKRATKIQVAPQLVPETSIEKPVLSAEIVDLTQLPAVPCPCGLARRAFADRDEFPGTVHLTQISKEAATHYHKEQTEVYVVLACDSDAAIELDGRRHPVSPQTAVLIPPGVRHRACGEMTVLILCTPNFDSADEHFD